MKYHYTSFRNKFLTLFALIFFTVPCSVQSGYTVFFDLPVTLIKPDEMAFLTDVIGVWEAIKYTVSLGNLFKLEHQTLKTLNLLGKQTGASELFARSHTGQELPLIYCKYLTGQVTEHDAIKGIKTAITKVERSGKQLFKNKSEKKLILRLIKAIFDPVGLTQHTLIIPGADQLVRTCAQRYGSNNLYILANMHAETMQLMAKADQLQPIMQHIPQNQMLISGTDGRLLPHPELFATARAAAKNVSPATCVFISGVPAHLEAAQKAGFHTIAITKGNYTQAIEQLP